MNMIQRWQIATFVIMALLISVIIIWAVVSGVSVPVSNLFEYAYAQGVTAFGGAGFLQHIQVSYFTNSFFPINNRVTLSQFANVLNGTYNPQLSLLQRFIEANGISAYPIIARNPISGSSLLSSYVTSPSSLTYFASQTNFPNASGYYVYPLYLVSYSVSCPQLSQFQSLQISSVSSPLIKYFGNVCGVLNSTKFSYQAIVGIDNNTATRIDGIYQELNPNYQMGTQNYLQPLSVFSQNGVQISTNNAINGTFLGYVASANGTLTIQGSTGFQKTIYPIRNIFSGTLATGKILLSSPFCWKSYTPTLTNYLQTAGYTSYPYLFSYNGSNYLCLTLNSTDTIMNASSNIDGSDFRLNPTILNGTLLNYPHIFATQFGIADSYQYIVSGVASTTPEQVADKQYWFIPNMTDIFSISKASQAVYTQFTAVQYLASTAIPILGQEPNYTSIPIESYYGSTLVTQKALIKNASTYLYGPLIQNLTYQYVFNAPKTGTPVSCLSICTYNGTIVYAQASVDSFYPYQYVNSSFGYLVLPQFNQTVYYNPQIAVIAQSPLRNDTNPNNETYKKQCLVINQYNCLFGLSAYQTFEDSRNYTSFIIYGEGQNTSFIVNGYSITGWKRMEIYLNNQINSSKLATISMLNQYGQQQWSASGIVENVSPDYIVMSPQGFAINTGAYPEARPLIWNWIDLIALIVIAVVVVPLGYVIYSTRFRQAFEKAEKSL